MKLSTGLLTLGGATLVATVISYIYDRKTNIVEEVLNAEQWDIDEEVDIPLKEV